MSTTTIAPTFYEADWVGLAKAGDGDAFRELVKYFDRRVFRIARLITQSDQDAEDVLIQSFLKAYSDLDECKENDKFWVWLFTITLREAFFKIRGRRQSPALLDDVAESCEDGAVREISPWEDNYQERYSREELASILEDAAQVLDPWCRAVFLLRDIEQFSIEDTAFALGVSIPVVKDRLLSARLELREKLTSHFTRTEH